MTPSDPARLKARLTRVRALRRPPFLEARESSQRVTCRGFNPGATSRTGLWVGPYSSGAGGARTRYLLNAIQECSPRKMPEEPPATRFLVFYGFHAVHGKGAVSMSFRAIPCKKPRGRTDDG